MTTMRRFSFIVPSVLALLAAAQSGCTATGGREPRAESAEPVSPAESAEFAETAIPGGGSGEAEPPPVEWANALARLPSITVGAYPDADEVSLLEWEDTRYATNGTYTTTWTTFSKILTQRGLEGNRTFSFSNDDFYGSTTVLVARIHAPDGTVRDVDLAANLAEAIDTGSLASNIHDPNDKTFTLAFPGLQVGDAVEITMSRTARRPRCEGVYSDYLTFESDHPILFQGARIEGPASMPLRSRAFRDAGPVSLAHAAVTNEAEGTIVETWTAAETPRYFGEPDMPPAYDCTARLLLSTAPDWESLSRWYARLCAPHLAVTNAAMAEKVAELVSSATNSATGDPGGPARRAAAIRALFDFVSREVRYMGAMAESEAPGYEPHDVSLTFDNRYGVCRDKAALLVAMLRMAGIDAWPVLINVGPRKDAQVPQPYFNHAIVAADSGDPDDPYLLMDPTSETTRSLLPEYLCEMSYLVARDDGETIRETPPLPVEGNLLRAHTVFTLNDDASADVKTTLSFLGVNDAAYRGYFASIPRDGIRAFFERLLQGVPGAVLTRWELRPAPEDLRKSPEPLVATVEYAIAEAARGEGGGACGDPATALLDLPDHAGALAIASRVVGDLGLEKRRFPLVTDYPCGFEETVELRTPDGVAVASAPDVTFPGEAVLFQDIPTPSGRHRALKLFRSRYSPEEYRTLREAREAEERAGRAPILLEGEGVPRLFAGRAFGGGLSDALARAVEPAPTDDLYTEFSRTTVDVSGAPAEWTVESTTRRRILTYAGQRKAGDLTFTWNPATSDFEVVDARVIAPDGTETPINPALDLFEGDQNWVADAPRYPAGRLATVSFPKLAPGMSVQWTTRRRAHDRDLFSFSETLGSLGSFGEISVAVVGTNDVARSFRVEPPFWGTLADRFPVETNATESATTYLVRGGGPGSQIVSEPNMPPLHRLAPALRASSQDANGRARALAARMWELSDPAAQTNAAALARSLVPDGGPAPGDEGRERAFVAIRDWCAVNLREAGPPYWDLPLSALSPADATLAARYGHEADLRILQLALLRAAGLCADPEIRLYDADWDGAPRRSGAADDVERAYASPSTFDTIAVAFPRSASGATNEAGGALLFLDGATQYAHPCGDRNQNRTGLRWRPSAAGAEPPLVRPEKPSAAAGDEFRAADDGTVAHYDIEVRTNGSARVRVEIEHGGSHFESFRKRYEQILPEERRRDAQRRAAALSQSARLVGEVVTETPPRGPCVLRFEAEVPDFAVPSGGGLSFRTPGALPVSPAMMRRRFPYRRAGSDSERTECAIRLPEGWTPARDGNPRIAAGGPGTGGGASRETEFRDGVLVLRSARELFRIEFDPALYGDFLAQSLNLRGPDSDTIRIVPPRPSGREDGAEAPVSVRGEPPAQSVPAAETQPSSPPR